MDDNVVAAGKAIERLAIDPDSSGGQFNSIEHAVEREMMARLVRLNQQRKAR